MLHNALPELDLEEVNTSTVFLGKRLSFPFIISSMTGGCKKCGEINNTLARVAERLKVAMALGSQRGMFENPALTSTYDLKHVMPSVPLLGNIGGVQLKDYSLDVIDGVVQRLELDAMIVHLNPLQEAIQPEGTPFFSGVKERIAALVDYLSVPVIVKEVGAGISPEVARQLKEIGVKYVDVAGYGGTSWSKVEYARNPQAVTGFEEWGLPTAWCVKHVSPILPTIASGGIRSGIDGVKALCLGAVMFGAASPVLRAYFEGGEGGVVALIEQWKEQFKVAMFLLGARTVNDLNADMLIQGW